MTAAQVETHQLTSALASHIRVLCGAVAANPHCLSYIRGISAVFSIFLALELACDRKTIDPEFSLLSLPLVPLEIASGVTKKVYSWLPTEVTASIADGVSAVGTKVLTRISEDPNFHPTARFSAKCALNGINSVTRFIYNPFSASTTAPTPKLPLNPSPDVLPKNLHNSVLILERVFDTLPITKRERPEGGFRHGVHHEENVSPLSTLSPISSKSSKHSKPLTKEEHVLLAAFPTPSTSRSTSRCSLFSSHASEGDAPAALALVEDQEDPFLSIMADVDNLSEGISMESSESEMCSSLTGGSSFGDEEFMEGLKLQLDMETFELEKCVPEWDDFCNTVDDFTQLKKVHDILDNMNTYHYILSHLGANDSSQLSELTPLTPSPQTSSDDIIDAPSPVLSQKTLYAPLERTSLNEAASPSASVFSDASSFDGLSGRSTTSGPSASSKRKKKHHGSFTSLASLGLDWDDYAPRKYSETEACVDADNELLIEPSFLDDEEFDTKLPLGLQELERSTAEARTAAIMSEYLDEPLLHVQGSDAPQADASFFDRSSPVMVPAIRPYPDTPEVVRRIIGAPTPIVQRRGIYTPTARPTSFPPSTPSAFGQSVSKTTSAPDMLSGSSRSSAASTPPESTTSSRKTGSAKSSIKESLSSRSSAFVHSDHNSKRQKTRKSKPFVGIPGSTPLSARRNTGNRSEGNRNTGKRNATSTTAGPGKQDEAAC